MPLLSHAVLPQASKDGGALFTTSLDSLVLTQLLLDGCAAPTGGGASLQQTSARCEQCSFIGNQVSASRGLG